VAIIPEAEPNSPTFTFGPCERSRTERRWRKKGKDADLGKKRKEKKRKIPQKTKKKTPF